MPSTIYIKLDNGVHTVHSDEACTSGVVAFTQKQLTPYDLAVAFCTSGTAGELAGVSGINISFKRTDRFNSGLSSAITTPGNLRQFNPNYTVSGSTTTTRYNFLTNLQSALIQADMLLAASVSYDVEVTWTLEGSAQTYKTTNSLTVTIQSAVYGSTENAPSAALSTSRTIYVDNNADVLVAQGFNAHTTLQDALDAAWALTPEPALATPVIISIGAIAAGDAVLPTTSGEWALIMRGDSRLISTIGSLSWQADHNGNLTLDRVRVTSIEIDKGADVGIEMEVLQSQVDAFTTGANVTMSGDVLSTIGSFTAAAVEGVSGDDADGDSGSSIGLEAGLAPQVTLSGAFTVQSYTAQGGNGGDGGDGNETYNSGSAGGNANSAGGLTINGSVRVEAVASIAGNGGAGGDSYGTTDGANGGNGADGLIISISSANVFIGAITATGGAAGTGGIAQGSSGSNGGDGTPGDPSVSVSYTAGIQVPATASAPDAPLVGFVIYSDGGLKLKDTAGNVSELGGVTGGATIATGDELEFTVDGVTYYIPAFRR